MCLIDTTLQIAESAIKLAQEREFTPDVQEKIARFILETRERLDLLERAFHLEGES